MPLKGTLLLVVINIKRVVYKILYLRERVNSYKSTLTSALILIRAEYFLVSKGLINLNVIYKDLKI